MVKPCIEESPIGSNKWFVITRSGARRGPFSKFEAQSLQSAEEADMEDEEESDRPAGG